MNNIRSLVRPAITIIFTVGLWAAFLLSKIQGDVLVGMYGPIIGFWFGERSAKKGGGE